MLSQLGIREIFVENFSKFERIIEKIQLNTFFCVEELR